MRYELTQDLLTGNQLIDSEHRQLFDAINALLDACAQGAGRTKINENRAVSEQLCQQAFPR